MADIFISYSRRDREFVHRLNGALNRAGHDVWVDWEDIPPTAEWMEEINSAIDSADTFVFVLSPSSIQSQVCRKEIDHAAAQNKRLVPIVCMEVNPDGVPESLAKLEWVFLRDSDDFEKSFGLLITALETGHRPRTDPHPAPGAYARMDTARERQELSVARQRPRPGGEWLAKGSTGGPAPTEEQARYVVASRRAATTRHVLGSVAAGLVIAVVLALVALRQRNQAVAARGAEQEQREIAEKRQTEAEAARDEARTQQQAAEAARKLADAARTVAEKRRKEAEYERNVAVYQRGLAESGQRSAMYRQLIASSEREQERSWVPQRSQAKFPIKFHQSPPYPPLAIEANSYWSQAEAHSG